MIAPFPAMVIPLSAGRALGLPWNAPVQAIAEHLGSPQPGIDFHTTCAGRVKILQDLFAAAVWRKFPAALALGGEDPEETMLRTITLADSNTLACALVKLWRGFPLAEALRCYREEIRPGSPALARIDHLPISALVANPDLMLPAA